MVFFGFFRYFLDSGNSFKTVGKSFQVPNEAIGEIFWSLHNSMCVQNLDIFSIQCTMLKIMQKERTLKKNVCPNIFLVLPPVGNCFLVFLIDGFNGVLNRPISYLNIIFSQFFSF